MREYTAVISMFVLLVSVVHAQESVCPEQKTKAHATGWDRWQFFGSPSPAAPDLTDVPDNVSVCAANLVKADQGLSFSSKSTNGSDKVTIQGEVRLTLFEDPVDRVRPVGDVENLEDKVFVYGGGNINPKASSGPPAPNWVSYGVGTNFTQSLTKNFDIRASTPGTAMDVLAHSWANASLKVGELENRIFTNNLFYRTASLSESIFVPFNITARGDIGNPKEPLNPKNYVLYPIYIAATLGGQYQKQRGSETPSPKELKQAKYDVPSWYSFFRVDLYAYPVPLIDKLFGSQWRNTNFTIHASDQVMNQDGGHLKQVGLAWKVASHASLQLSRTVGPQDPLSSFGVFPSPLYQGITELKLAVTNN